MPSMPKPEIEARSARSSGTQGIRGSGPLGCPAQAKPPVPASRRYALSSDLLRNILFDDVEEQRYQGLVFSTLSRCFGPGSSRACL